MERVKALINTLQEQVAQNAGATALLATIQQIQLELTGGSALPQSRQLGTAKVAVVMPAHHARFMPPAEVVEKCVEAPVAKAPKAAVTHDYDRPQNEPKKNGESGWLFDPMKEIPTLSQQVNVREVNDIIGESGHSINDKLKTDRTELAAVLTELPLRDLKKGIGVNDRFVFLNELFRGDEPMFERSVKTINSFRILAEAEYWIERELKVKLGWDDGKAATQHFYQLVRRRFS